MDPKFPYEIEELRDDVDMFPAELKIFENPPSDWDPSVTPEILQAALLDHCRISSEQFTQLQPAVPQ